MYTILTVYTVSKETWEVQSPTFNAKKKLKKLKYDIINYDYYFNHQEKKIIIEYIQ